MMAMGGTSPGDTPLGDHQTSAVAGIVSVGAVAGWQASGTLGEAQCFAC